MSSSRFEPSCQTVGLIGFGAFGRVIADHLAPHAGVRAYDPFLSDAAFDRPGVFRGTLEQAVRCPVVILAVPVSALPSTVDAVAPYLVPGSLVVDVGSVKVLPAKILQERLPPYVEIVATHPLFGPQSAKGGIRGLKIAVCPLRGVRWRRAIAVLRHVLGLKVLLTTPDAHDREMAIVQGLTHLVAKALVRMEPLPVQMTTRSFEYLLQAVAMVRHDAPEVLEAIESANPYAAEIRQRFFAAAGQAAGGEPEEPSRRNPSLP